MEGVQQGGLKESTCLLGYRTWAAQAWCVSKVTSEPEVQGAGWSWVLGLAKTWLGPIMGQACFLPRMPRAAQRDCAPRSRPCYSPPAGLAGGTGQSRHLPLDEQVCLRGRAQGGPGRNRDMGCPAPYPTPSGPAGDRGRQGWARLFSVCSLSTVPRPFLGALPDPCPAPGEKAKSRVLGTLLFLVRWCRTWSVLAVVPRVTS